MKTIITHTDGASNGINLITAKAKATIMETVGNGTSSRSAMKSKEPELTGTGTYSRASGNTNLRIVYPIINDTKSKTSARQRNFMRTAAILNFGMIVFIVACAISMLREPVDSKIRTAANLNPAADTYLDVMADITNLLQKSALASGTASGKQTIVPAATTTTKVTPSRIINPTKVKMIRISKFKLITNC